MSWAIICRPSGAAFLFLGLPTACAVGCILSPLRGWVCSRLGVHVGAEDGVDAGLVAALLAIPAEQVGVEAHGHDFFGDRHDNLGVFPEGFVGGAGVGIGKNSAAYLGQRHAAPPVPVGGAAPTHARPPRVEFKSSLRLGPEPAPPCVRVVELFCQWPWSCLFCVRVLGPLSDTRQYVRSPQVLVPSRLVLRKS